MRAQGRRLGRNPTERTSVDWKIALERVSVRGYRLIGETRDLEVGQAESNRPDRVTERPVTYQS